MIKNNTRRAQHLQRQTMDIAMSTPQVISQRVGQMMMPGYNPTGKDQAEFNTMILEKVTAFSESWMAMGVATMQAQQRFVMDLSRMNPFMGSPLSWQSMGQNMLSSQLNVLNKGLKPVSSRVKANAKRLSK